MAIDLGKKSSYIYIVVGDNGEVRTERYIPTTKDGFSTVLLGLDKSTVIVEVSSTMDESHPCWKNTMQTRKSRIQKRKTHCGIDKEEIKEFNKRIADELRKNEYMKFLNTISRVGIISAN